MGKKKGGLGASLLKTRFKGRDSRLAPRTVQTDAPPRRARAALQPHPAPSQGATAHTTDLDDGHEWSKLGSCTEQVGGAATRTHRTLVPQPMPVLCGRRQSLTRGQGNLEDFLSTAELAGTDFTAERLNARLLDAPTNEALQTESRNREMRVAQKVRRGAGARRWCSWPTDHRLRRPTRTGCGCPGGRRGRAR